MRIGPLSLQLAEEDAAHDAEPLDLTRSCRRPRPPERASGSIATAVRPFWVPWEFAGKTGQCRQCGKVVAVSPMAVVHAESPDTEETPDAEIDSTRSCGVCHAEISAFEEATRCQACGTVFHIECWEENRGCSVYGCSQVNALEQPRPSTTSPHDTAVADCFDEEPLNGDGTKPHLGGEDASVGGSRPVPWPYALLAAGVVGAVLGSLTFGATALASAAAAPIYFVRAKPKSQRAVVMLSIVVSLIGLVTGVAISYYWWVDGRTWQAMRR